MEARPREVGQNSPARERLLPEARQRRLIRVVIILFGALLAVGAWQGYGVLIHGIEGSYDR
jgi:hypothetical protein